MPEDRITTYETPTARRGTRRVLAVQALAARTSWLDGLVYWLAGQAVWQHAGQSTTPQSSDLALAQRSHYRIRRYPISADLVFGDHHAWLERRTMRLELAKRLMRIRGLEVDQLRSSAAAGDQQAMGLLLDYLEAEAISVNALPSSPTAALASLGARAVAWLLDLLQGDDPIQRHPAARALAGLILGMQQISCPRSDPWVQRSVAWGRQHGLSTDPVLAIRFLASDNGVVLLQQLLLSQPQARELALSAQFIRELLAHNYQPDQIVAFAQELPMVVAIVPRVVHATKLRGMYDRRQRLIRSTHRQEVLALLQRFVQIAAWRGLDPAALTGIHHLLQQHCALDTYGQIAAENIFTPIECICEAFDQPAWNGQFGQVITFLAQQHPRIWPIESAPSAVKPAAFNEWIRQQMIYHWYVLINDMCRIGQIDLITQVAALDVLSAFANCCGDEPVWLLKLLKRFPLPSTTVAVPLHYRNDPLNQFIYAISDLRQRLGIRFEAFQPVVEALGSVAPEHQLNMLTMIFQKLWSEPFATREGLVLVAQRMPLLAQMTSARPGAALGARALCGLLAFDYIHPQHASRLQIIVAQALITSARREGEAVLLQRSSLACMLAAVLGQANPAQTLAILHVGLRHDLQRNHDLLEQRAMALRRSPGLCAALGRIFPQQPHRCVDLIMRVGPIQSLGSQALEPLALLQPDLADIGPAFVSSDPAWQAAIAIAPELAEEAAIFCYYRWVSGEDTGIPIGVQQALAQPLRYADERDHLRRLVQEHPERHGLVQRLANLEARLCDPTMHALSRLEAAERLAQATSLAQLQAAEVAIAACYQRRLIQIIGPHAATIPLTDNLINAIQLSADIRSNRKLLQKLIRATLQGDTSWHERLPGNQAFLQSFRERGYQVEHWRAEYPEIIALPGLRGGQLRLAFAPDPLQILQMGNAFGTCLSLGGINAFSTVANAIELNKRVVFGYTNDGHIVARALIALTDQFELQRFHIYTGDLTASLRSQIAQAVLDYLKRFAAYCQLTCTEQGQIPTLVSESWYDDGCESWNETGYGSDSTHNQST